MREIFTDDPRPAVGDSMPLDAAAMDAERLVLLAELRRSAPGEKVNCREARPVESRPRREEAGLEGSPAWEGPRRRGCRPRRSSVGPDRGPAPRAGSRPADPRD